MIRMMERVNRIQVNYPSLLVQITQEKNQVY
jgi:hypothetical protein